NRTKFRVCVLPESDEARVVRRRTCRVTAGVVELAEALVNAGEQERTVERSKRIGFEALLVRSDRAVGPTDRFPGSAEFERDPCPAAGAALRQRTQPPE